MRRTLLFALGFLFSQDWLFPRDSRWLEEVASRIKSNGINDLCVSGDTLWVGSGSGLSYTPDQGETWIHYSRADGFGKGGVSALAKEGPRIWVATAYDTLTREAGELPAGGGITFSPDQGKTWHWIPQPRDARGETRYRPTTTHIQNLTYDIALSPRYVWIASFGGGLRRSPKDSFGSPWEVVTVDGLPFSALDHLTHRAFSVLFDGEALWAGTAGGVHRSVDEGATWTTFSHQNQPQGISGNFVVALGCQVTKERRVLWAATVEALGEGEYRAVSKTEDGGLTWEVVLPGVFAHNFAFDDSVVYVATDQGLFKSLDGKTWAVFPGFYDAIQDRRLWVTEVNTAAIGPASLLWVGTSDGLAMTSDGWRWRIFQAYADPGLGHTPATYAYPNPFSPLRHNRLGEEGHVRILYRVRTPSTVTVRLYDFGLRLVRTLVQAKARSTAGDFVEVWDGKNDCGERVANGVYFYRIEIPGQEVLWGKIMVVD